MSYSGAREYLDSFINYEIQRKPRRTLFKLKRVRRLLKFIGDPHHKLKCLHVAGTKGKGSTCAFVASILQSAGYTVGLYTSPHLSDYRERIRILTPHACPTFFHPLGVHQRGTSGWKRGDAFAGKASEEDLRCFIKEIRPFIEKIKVDRSVGRLTYFEVLTVLALYYFQKKRVDFVVLETGLGGRLDATNVVNSLVSAITPVSLEHTEFLGKTIRRIAMEKAGIIKSKEQIVIVAPQSALAEKVIRSRCHKTGAKFFFVGQDLMFEAKKTTLKEEFFSIKGLRGNYSNLRSRLIGSHQVVNAAVAIGMIESLSLRGLRIGKRAISQGIKNTIWPGRFEIVGEKPLTILDGAHNAASCRVLVKTVKKVVPNKRVVLVLGVSADKDIQTIAEELAKIASLIIATKADHPRAYEFKRVELKKLFPGKETVLSGDVASALQFARRNSTVKDVILVTGSLFVVGEARESCINSKV